MLFPWSYEIDQFHIHIHANINYVHMVEHIKLKIEMVHKFHNY